MAPYNKGCFMFDKWISILELKTMTYFLKKGINNTIQDFSQFYFDDKVYSNPIT